MRRKSDHQANVSFFTFVVAFLLMLAQAVAVPAQADGSEQAGDLSLYWFFDAPYRNATVPGNTGPALLALADAAVPIPAASGGLWLSGDIAEGFAYLQWIVGNQPAGLLKLNSGAKVSFNLRMLAKAAGITSESTADQRARIASFVRSDEGLLLLAEVMNGPYRFLLHIGPTAPTRAGDIKNDSARNFDNRFDSRINPLYKNQQKPDRVCPPEGFDSLIAINHKAGWFNVFSNRLMPTAQLAFHELAESHARLVLGFDYLTQCDKPGAHATAINREIMLMQQRPAQLVVLPIGTNLLLASREDWLWLDAALRDRNRKGASPFKVYEEARPFKVFE